MTAPRAGTVLILVLVGLAVATLAAEPFGWRLVKKQIRARFPGVQQIATEDLAARLADAAAPKPLLLDVRTAEEYSVSHLPGARHVSPAADAAAIDPLASRDTPIVTYCSVGYRSSAFAERLQKAGYRNVVNLEGSIFEWANSGRTVVREGHPVREVHSYDRTWGTLLKKELRAVKPSGS